MALNCGTNGEGKPYGSLRCRLREEKNGSLMTKLLLTELIWVRRENISLSFIGTDLKTSHKIFAHSAFPFSH